MTQIPDSVTAFGSAETQGHARSATYSVTKLPLDTEILLQITSADGGSFVRTLNLSLVDALDLLNPVANGVNFVYVPA
jgi:hypothetical protein